MARGQLRRTIRRSGVTATIADVTLCNLPELRVPAISSTAHSVVSARRFSRIQNITFPIWACQQVRAGTAQLLNHRFSVRSFYRLSASFLSLALHRKLRCSNRRLHAACTTRCCHFGFLSVETCRSDGASKWQLLSGKFRTTCTGRHPLCDDHRLASTPTKYNTILKDRRRSLSDLPSPSSFTLQRPFRHHPVSSQFLFPYPFKRVPSTSSNLSL